MAELTWHTRLTAKDRVAIGELVDSATQVDGRSPVDERALAQESQADHLLLHGSGGQLVGYLTVSKDQFARSVVELVVSPHQRRRGYGTALMQELVRRFDPAELRIWAHGNHQAAHHLAATFGFSPARELVRMRWSATHNVLPELTVPEGFSLRAFMVGVDEAAVVEVNNKAFSWHPEQSGWTVADIQERESEPWFDPAGFFLAVADQRVIGFHWTKVHQARPEFQHQPIGEVYVVAVDPDVARHGLGSALTLAGMRYLQAQGLPAVMLYVESDNTAAIRLYERWGFVYWDSDTQFARNHL